MGTDPQCLAGKSVEGRGGNRRGPASLPALQGGGGGIRYPTPTLVAEERRRDGPQNVHQYHPCSDPIPGGDSTPAGVGNRRGIACPTPSRFPAPTPLPPSLKPSGVVRVARVSWRRVPSDCVLGGCAADPVALVCGQSDGTLWQTLWRQQTLNTPQPQIPLTLWPKTWLHHTDTTRGAEGTCSPESTDWGADDEVFQERQLKNARGRAERTHNAQTAP